MSKSTCSQEQCFSDSINRMNRMVSHLSPEPAKGWELSQASYGPFANGPYIVAGEGPPRDAGCRDLEGGTPPHSALIFGFPGAHAPCSARCGGSRHRAHRSSAACEIIHKCTKQDLTPALTPASSHGPVARMALPVANFLNWAIFLYRKTLGSGK